MSSARLATAFVFVAGAMGCGGDGTQAGVDAGGVDSAPGDQLNPPPAGEGLQLRMDATIQAGEEITYCQYYVLPAGAGIDIDRFQHRYTTGSHHLLLFPTTLTAAEVAMDQERFVCSSRGDLKNLGVAYGAQEPEAEFSYPAGVAMHFDSEEVVMLQAHYINSGDTAIDADVRVNLWYATVAITAYAGTLFYYDWAIVVPPAPGTATVKMRCVVPGDVNLLFAASHMHRRGVGFRSTLNGGALTAPHPLFETTEWESPDPATFQPVLPVTAGQVIEYECDFQNDLPDTVIEGASAETNEMCMFVAAYYPKLSDEAEFCLVPGSGPQRDGTRTCSETLTCMNGAANDVASEQCIMDTCAASSQPFNDFVFCLIRNNCGADPSCVTTNCATEFTTCQNATCS